MEQTCLCGVVTQLTLINFDDVTKEDIKEHNSTLPQIPGHPYKILVIRDSRSRKTNSLFNLINQEPDINNICLYANDQYKVKYQLPINKKENRGAEHLNDFKCFIEYSNDMVNIYKKIEEYNPNKQHKILIIFDDLIVNMLGNIRLNPVVTELFSRGRKLNISLVLLHKLILLYRKILD